jgi:hypothetical protein
MIQRMKHLTRLSVFSIFTAATLLGLSIARADSDGNLSPPYNSENENPVQLQKKKPKKTRGGGPSRKNADSIKGHCTLVASPSNPIQGPCISTLLILRDAQGTEISTARTSSNGMFEFLVDQDQEDGRPTANAKYKVFAGSESYEVVAPAETVRAGRSIEVQLRMK